MPDLSIRLFGSPELRRGNQEVIIQRRKDLALLIYLITTSQPHRRDKLAALFWEDQNQAEARSNLRKSLSRLKSILGENVLLTSQDQIRVNPDYPMDLDVEQFNLRVSQFHKHARHAVDTTLCHDCQKALQEAARIYQADFLAGFSVSDSSVFEEWQFFQTESLRKSLAEVLEQLANWYANKQDYKTAVEYCRRWVALDRLNETAQRKLMMLYASSGERAVAKRQFEEYKRILKEELDAEPEEETLQLFKNLQKKKTSPRSGTTTVALPRVETRKPQFPAHPAPFIGREKEVGEIISVLCESQSRLLTLLGPGGSGKTRLALQVGRNLDQEAAEPFRDGVWLVQLAPLTESKSILDAIMQSLGMLNRDTFFGEIRGREMLLVLDNFEHLLDANSARLVTEILSVSPRTKILITSREQLDVEGEYVFPVGGLETPASEKEQSLFPVSSALQLFEQCARRVQPGFKLTEENYRSILDICNAVQGMPLAIELAASWVEIYSPQEIHQEIVRSLDFLQSNWRDLPDRQRSLRAVFDSSWSLLDKTSRPVIKALSVFRSSFTREAAQAISGASAKTLLDLTHKSWIQRLSNGRYQIHELLRQFAYLNLQREEATFDLVMEQYSYYYATQTRQLWEDMKGADQQSVFSRMEAEFDNIQVAWSWLVSTRELETAIQNMLLIFFHYAELRGKTLTLLHMLDTALESLPSTRQDAQDRQHEIILRAAKGAFFRDGFPLRYSIYDSIFPIDKTSIGRAWTLAQQQQAFHTLGFWGILLSYIYGRIIQYDKGARRLKQVLPFFERTGQSWELATGYLHLLKLMIPNEQHSLRRQEQFTKYLSRAKNIFAALEDTVNIGQIMNLWGDLSYQQQDLEGAIKNWQLALDSMLNSGEWMAATHMRWQISGVYMQIGDFEKAFDGFHAVADVFREHGLRLEEVSALSKESFEKVRYGDIEEALQIRHTCLEMILEIGLSYQIAWNYWEMGEVLRVKGDVTAAAQWYERAYQIFDREQDNNGRAYYFRGLGDIALGEQNYEAARSHFSTSADLAKSTNHTWLIAYSLSELARAQLELEDSKSAKKNLRAAFQYGLKTLDKGIVLVILVEYAELCSRMGKASTAVELCSLVKEHFASWHETRKHAATLLDALRNQMPARKYAQSMKKGRALDLWACVKSLINELGTITLTRVPSKKESKKTTIRNLARIK